MLFAVNFVDRADRLAVRQQYLPDHLRWLDTNREHVLVAGSLRQDPGAAPIGGLWIVEAPSQAYLEALLESDPFWIHGLRESRTILHWSKAFPDRKVLV
jgi:uncharacterized protein